MCRHPEVALQTVMLEKFISVCPFPIPASPPPPPSNITVTPSFVIASFPYDDPFFLLSNFLPSPLPLLARPQPSPQTAMHCKSIGNFYSLFTILGALDTARVRKLKGAWLAISREHQRIYDKLLALTVPDRNMKVCVTFLIWRTSPHRRRLNHRHPYPFCHHYHNHRLYHRHPHPFYHHYHYITDCSGISHRHSQASSTSGPASFPTGGA